jgi:hypothetical protein
MTSRKRETALNLRTHVGLRGNLNWADWADWDGADGEPTNAKVTDRMRRMYPSYAQEEFLLAQSVAFHGPDSNPRRHPRREKSLFE